MESNKQAVEFGTIVDNGLIEIPDIYRKEYTNNVKVILMKENINIINDEINIKERIAAAERLAGIASANPLSLDEIRNERLARQ